MKTVTDRINDLQEDEAKDLSIALENFKCSNLFCGECPLWAQGDGCISVLVHNRVKRGKC